MFAECIYLPATKQWRNARNTWLKDTARHIMRYPMREEPIGPNLYRFQYSNRTSYMAARLIETKTGQHANQFIKQTIFEPLGMENTFSIPSPLTQLDEGVTDSQRQRVVHMLNMVNGMRGTNESPEGIAPCNLLYWCDVRPWRLFWAAGGTHSTPRDLLTFMVKLRDNEIPAFSATTRSRLITDQNGPAQSQFGSGMSRTAARTSVVHGAGTSAST